MMRSHDATEKERQRRERLEVSFEIKSCPVIYASCPGDPPHGWDATPGHLALKYPVQVTPKS